MTYYHLATHTTFFHLIEYFEYRTYLIKPAEKRWGWRRERLEKKELCLKRNIWLKREALGITRHYHTISDSIAYKWLMEALRELLLLSTHTSHKLHQLWTLYMKLEEKQDLRWEDEKKHSEVWITSLLSPHSKLKKK